MNVYEAIMKAADHIEKNPGDFDFGNFRVPGCGTPGCALGWIGVYAGIGAGASVHHVVEKQLLRNGDFYENMRGLIGGGWHDDAKQCARGLRLYAERYHAHEKPKPTPPDWNAMASTWTVGYDVRSQELA